MRKVGLILIAIGLVWGVVAFNISTSVSSPYGYGEKIHNLSLADEKRNHLIAAGLCLITGSIFFGFGTATNSRSASPSKDETQRTCPFCAESINVKALLCKHCGKDVPPIGKVVTTILDPEDLPSGEYPEDAVEALTLAAARGDWARVLQLAKGGTDVNQPNARNKTALEIANARKDALIVSVLKDHGALPRTTTGA